MKKKRKNLKKLLSFVLSAALTAGTAATAALVTSASGVNNAEQRILDELNTSVSLNGKTRTIPLRYIDQARYYFDTVTCISEEDADVIIGKIEEAKSYIEGTGVDNFSDLSDEQLDHIMGIANEASSSCGIVLKFIFDRMGAQHHLDVECENNPAGEDERISLSDEERTISAEAQEQIKQNLGITGFELQGIPGSPELSDPDGDGVWTGRAVLRNISSSMITELTSGGIATGKYGICFRIADSGNESRYWAEYESSDERTCGSSTALCADAGEGDSIVLNVRLDTTKISRYAEKTASELGNDAYTLWDTSLSTEKYVETESIEFDRDTLALETGSSDTLSVKFTPEDSTDKNVTWSSSDESVAVVSEGIVQAAAPGQAVITAETENGLLAECTVTVTDPVKEVEELVLSENKLSLLKGETGVLSVRLIPEDADDCTVTWTSSDESVAVAEDGVVTAKGEGMALITATASNGKAASCFVTVKDTVIDVENIRLEKTSIELVEGKTGTVNAFITPDNASDKTVIWTSSNSQTASVSGGKITALRAGKAIITATASNGKAASCFVTVKENIVPVSEVRITSDSSAVEAGKKITLKASVYPSDADDKSITWSSSNNKVATVSGGTVTGVSAGTVTITAAASNGISGTYTLTVKPAYVNVTGVNISKTSITLAPGASAALTASVLPANASNKTITWKSSNTKIVTVNNGKITAAAVGTATVYAAASNGKSASCAVTVKQPYAEVTGIGIPKSLTMTKGDKKFLSPVITPSNAADKTVSWTSSNANVASVSGGNVTAKSAGTAVITARTKNGKSSSCTVTVKNPVIQPTGITLSKTSVTLNKGGNTVLTATVAPGNATNKNVTWRSYNTSKATVSNGKITAVGLGKTTIVASTSNGKTAKCIVTINDPTVYASGIKLNRNSLVLGKGESYTVKATVNPANTTNKTVTWVSGNTKVATVSGGVIKAVNNGTTTITARTSNGKTASCQITVKNAPSKITISQGVLTLGVGETYKLSASIDKNAFCSQRTFRSSNSSIIKMTRSSWQGEFKALKPGVAYVTVRTYNGKESTCKVTVKAAPTQVALNKGVVYMKSGQRSSVSAVIAVYSGCASRTFRTSDSSVIKMTRTNWQGEFTALKKGTAYVTVRTYNGKEASCKVIVS